MKLPQCAILYFFASPPKFIGAGKKSNKKRAPKTNTASRSRCAHRDGCFREGALIKLLYYCGFNSSTLITDLKTILMSTSCFYLKNPFKKPIP